NGLTSGEVDITGAELNLAAQRGAPRELRRARRQRDARQPTLCRQEAAAARGDALGDEQTVIAVQEVRVLQRKGRRLERPQRGDGRLTGEREPYVDRSVVVERPRRHAENAHERRGRADRPGGVDEVLDDRTEPARRRLAGHVDVAAEGAARRD